MSAPVSVPAVGEVAPDFRLKGPGGQFVSLSDYRGQPVVLVFYPLAFTPVCAHQLPELQGKLGEFEALGAAVIGISVDSWQANEVFARQLGLTYPLLSDFKRETSRAYGLLDEERFYSERAVLVVGGDGRVAHVDVAEGPALAQIPNVQRVLERLEALRR